MSNQYYYSSRPQAEFSPIRENYNLRVDDIPGALPKFGYTTKNIQHYATKLINDQRPFETRRETQQKLYTNGHHHEDFSPTSSQKKHYNIHNESEISKYNVMSPTSKKPLNSFSAGLPRQLDVESRPYVPVSYQSQSVKNNYANKVQDRHPGAPQKPIQHQQQDTLDQFQEKRAQRGVSEDRGYASLQEASLENQRPQYQQAQNNYSHRQLPQEENYARYNQEYQGSRQELSPPPSSRRTDLNKLGYDIIFQQAALEKKMRETMRRRAFNIISNNPTSQFEGDTRPYGASLKGMLKNTEHTRNGFGTTKNWGQFQSTMRSDPYYQTQNQEGSMKQFGNNSVAGMNNDYNETSYRYANQMQPQAPLSNDQYYGAGALKNMSGVKLY